MTSLAPFSEDELRFMLSNYKLGTYVDSQLLTAGGVQVNVALESTEGRYVLKYYQTRTPESVGFETNLLVYIRKRNFPCPTPLRNRNKAFVSLYKDKPFVLYSFMEGDAITSPTAEQKQAIIKTAAMLQRYTKNYGPQNRRYRWNYNKPFCRWYIEQCATATDDAGFLAKADWYYQQLDTIRLDPGIPKSICHCDYDSSNILFEGDQLVALLDFDDANITYRTMDLVYLMDMWAWQAGGFDLVRAKPIVDAYMEHRKLKVLEKRYLYEVHKLKILIDSMWFFDQGDPTDFPGQQRLNALLQIDPQDYINTFFGDGYPLPD